ncbi:OsmC family protein [Candidatus Omnitrophota bacterium]
MGNVKVEYTGKKSFKMQARDHEIKVDLPVEMGGDNAAPTPPELFVAALGSCMGVYALGYLKTAKLDAEGLTVSLDWEYDEGKKKIGTISAKISAPNADLGDRKQALVSAAEKCLLHNTLHESPEMTTTLEEN